MLIIFGVTFDNKKRVKYALPKLFGIGFYHSKKISDSLGLSPYATIKDITEEMEYLITKQIKERFSIEDSLREFIKSNLNKRILNNSVRGFRYKNRLPVRGQRTHSNAKTCRRIRF